MSRAPSTMEGWISAFLESQAAELDAAKNTRLAYGRDLLSFASWLGHRQSSFAKATREDVENYLISCEAEGLSKSTRARRLSSIRQLFRFAHDENWRDDHPALRIHGPGAVQRLPKTLSIEQVQALIGAANAQGRSETDRARNTLLVELLYATGLRVSELVEMPVSAARGDPRMILVKGKGGKERMVPLSDPAREALTEWLRLRDAAETVARAKGISASKFLFPGAGAAGHLSRQNVNHLLRELAYACGIPTDQVTPHTLRHAFATHLLAGGADLRVIQMLLGHADVATTEIYTHVLDDHLKSLVLTRHPLAQADNKD